LPAAGGPHNSVYEHTSAVGQSSKLEHPLRRWQGGERGLGNGISGLEATQHNIPDQRGPSIHHDRVTIRGVAGCRDFNTPKPRGYVSTPRCPDDAVHRQSRAVRKPTDLQRTARRSRGLSLNATLRVERRQHLGVQIGETVDPLRRI
jgi:hypothetical protein